MLQAFDHCYWFFSTGSVRFILSRPRQFHCKILSLSILRKVLAVGRLFDSNEISGAAFGLLMLSCILRPPIFAMKMREALLETIFIIKPKNILLRTVRILLKTSLTRTTIFSVDCVSSVLA